MDVSSEYGKILLDDLPPPLSVAEEINLFARYKQGDEEAKQKIMTHNQRLVVKILKENRVNPRNRNWDDLFQEGMLGLYRAAEKFDPDKGFKFSTYATWWIRRSVAKELAKRVTTSYQIPAHMCEALGRAARLAKWHGQDLVKLSAEEIGALTPELSLGTRQMIVQILATGFATSLDQKIDAGVTAGDLIGYDQLEYRLVIDDLTVGQLIRQALQRLPQEERRLILLRMEGHGLRSIQRALQLKQAQITQLEAKAFRRLRSLLPSDISLNFAS